MSSVSISFNANQLKREVSKILDKKVKAVTKDPNLKERLQRLYYTYVIQLSDFPEVTGALKLKGGGKAPNGYMRYSSGSWGGHHGIEFDAYEERPNYNRHYGFILREIFGDPVSQGMLDAMIEEGLWEQFCNEAAPIIAEYMNNG